MSQKTAKKRIRAKMGQNRIDPIRYSSIILLNSSASLVYDINSKVEPLLAQNDRDFFLHNPREATVVYRLIAATLIGNFFDDPFRTIFTIEDEFVPSQVMQG